MSQEDKMQSSLLLYKIDLGPPSWAVMMLCDILGLEYDTKEPDVLNQENKNVEYKKMNPMGTIPVLVDGDFIISESHPTMKYMLAKYGKKHEERLFPSDIKTRALVDQCMFFDAGVIFVRLKEIAMLTVFHGLKCPTENHIQKLEDAYSVLEAYLENNKYIATNHLTLADLSLGTTTIALQGIHKLDEKKFPRTVKWLARLTEEKYFQKFCIPGSKLLTGLFKDCWEKNSKT